MVESQPSKLLVAGSIPVSRSRFIRGGFAPSDSPDGVTQRGPRSPAVRDAGCAACGRAA